MAIMEYLNEIHPEPPLLPADPRGRARVRALSLITVADSHPLIVPRVRNHLAALQPGRPGKIAWVPPLVRPALDAYEGHLARDKATGIFATATGDDGRPLPRQPVGRREGSSTSTPRPLPNFAAHRRRACQGIDAVRPSAHPLKQPGAPADLSH